LIERSGRAEGLIQINPRRILSVVYGPYRIRDSLHLDMSTLDNATERIPDLALVLPVAALLTVLLHRKV